MARVLIIGIDPDEVDFSDPSLPPGMDASTNFAPPATIPITSTFPPTPPDSASLPSGFRVIAWTASWWAAGCGCRRATSFSSRPS